MIPFIQIINELKKQRVEIIEMTGFGEPLLDFLFFERCEYIKRVMPNIKIYITSNFSTLGKGTIDDIIKYIDMIKISFYGFTPNTYDYMHGGKLDFNTTFNNIMSLIRRKHELKSKTPYIIMSYIDMFETTNEKDLWIDLWEMFADEVIVWKPHNWADIQNYRKVDYSKQISCGRPFTDNFYIHVNGDVSPCCWDINKKLLIGNIYTKTLEQISKSHELEFRKEKHKNKDFTRLLCENCEQTNKDESALVYSSTNRKVGEMTSDRSKLI